MFTGVYGVSVGFSCNIYGKKAVKITGKIVYVVGKPCNICSVGIPARFANLFGA